ncbi:hypothetical protein LOTGIDRAFT_79473, partial [Lottia gigantea]
QCLTVSELLKSFHFEDKGVLYYDEFRYLCPALLYQIENKSCLRADFDLWGYSTVAVIIISLGGLLGVAVIPIMQKVFYNHLLQFLVALAVGALAGDSLLHLLPHV